MLRRTVTTLRAENIPLEIEHILCRARGGTYRVSNLTLACTSCNIKKGTHLIEDFLHKKPEVLARILAQAKTPLKDAAAVNATRWHLFERLKATGLPLETGSGGLTKYNRAQRNLPKTHWLDAVCVATPVTGIHYSGLTPYSCGKGVCSTSYPKAERPTGNTV